MGDRNQLLFIGRHADSLDPPYLEVGSKDYGSTQNLREIFASRGPYVGVDLEDGPGVDVVLDLAEPPEETVRKFDGTRFGTIFCLSVLEHCRQPFAMADNLTRLLAPNGKACISVPFAWKFHGYPSDYWRFTHEGVKQLFPRLEFDVNEGTAATSREGQFEPLDGNLGKIPFGSKQYWRRRLYLRGISSKLLSYCAKFGILRWLAGYPYVLAPTNVMMIGTLRA